MENLLLYARIEYKTEETPFGTWKSHLNDRGQLFREFTSHQQILGMPLLHYTNGRDPNTGRRKIARGFVAIGRIAIGVIPIGQLAIGIVPIGQAAFGLIFGLGQLSTGVVAIGQVAIGVLFGLGQFATGLVCIGQFAFGFYALGQYALGPYHWGMNGTNTAAKTFFKKWLPI